MYGRLSSLALVTALSGFFLPVSALAASQHKKIAPDVENAAANSTVSVLIRYYQNPTADAQARIVARHGKVSRTFSSLPFVAAQLPTSEAASLASDADVAYVSIDRPVQGQVAEYTAEPINAPQAWAQGQTGSGVGIALIDSGVSPLVDDLGTGKKSRVVLNLSFVAPFTDTGDEYGHGTHIAGLIAGDGTDSTGPQDYRTFKGIAPGANIISLKVLDANGSGTDSTVIAAIDTAILLRKAYKIRVINLSLGRPIYESYEDDPLCQAVEAATQQGILVVVAAGNAGRDLNLNPDGYGTIESPGNDPYALTVGAMKTNGTASIGDDTIASYSSKGPSFIDQIAKPDIVAPGNLVPSLLTPNSTLSNETQFVTYFGDYQTNGSLTTPSNKYFPLSGTSMATGVTSGAAGVLFGAFPKLTPAQAKAILMNSANKSTFPATSSVVANGITYNANYDVFTVGAGYLDIASALQLAGSQKKFPAGDALSPAVVFDPSSQNTYLQFDQTSLLGSTILWGSVDTYGSQAFTGAPAPQTILWGSSAVAGGSDPQGFTILWGSSTVGSQTILWGSGSPAAATILWGSTTSTTPSTILWGSYVDPSTILWGSSSPNAQTILWGSNYIDPQTILWGSAVPYEQ
jgi:serine protease AprX